VLIWLFARIRIVARARLIVLAGVVARKPGLQKKNPLLNNNKCNDKVCSKKIRSLF
jgi:hypothetical protein